MFFRIRYTDLGHEKGLTISAIDEFDLMQRIKSYGINPDNLISWQSDNGNGYMDRSHAEFNDYYYRGRL